MLIRVERVIQSNPGSSPQQRHCHTDTISGIIITRSIMVVKISRQPAHFTVYSDKHTSFSERKWQASAYAPQNLLCYFSHISCYSQSFLQLCLLLELKRGSEKQRTPCWTLGCTQASSSGDLWTAVSTMVKFYLATFTNQPSIRTFVFDNCPHLVCSYL